MVIYNILVYDVGFPYNVYWMVIKMKLDIKTVFVGLAICISYTYINKQPNNDINQIVSILSEPNIKVISLTN